jgi:MFS family permease
MVRSSLRYLSGNLLVFALTDMLGNFARSMVFPYASLYILALGGDAARIGLVAFLSQLAGLVLLPVAGHICDHSDRVRLMVLAGFLSSLFLLVMILTPNWQGIALASLLSGLVMFQFPAYASLVADSLPPGGRGQGMAAQNALSNSLAIFAPYLAGVIIQRYSAGLGMRMLYGAMFVLYLASSFILLRFLKEPSATRRDALRLPALLNALGEAYRGIPRLVRQMPGPLKALALVVVLSFVTNGLTGSFWVVFATERLALSVEQWGLIMLLEAVARLALFLPAGLLADRWGRTASLNLALAAALLATPLFVAPEIIRLPVFATTLLVRLILAAAFDIALVACMALMADLTPRQVRGQSMAALGQGGIMPGAVGAPGGPSVGYLVIPPLMAASLAGGFLYNLHPASPWIVSTAAGLLALLISLFFIRDPARAEA